MIVFTQPNGTWSSLRADGVDLPASQAATEAGARPAPEAETEPAPRESVLVITDDDVGHVNPLALVEAEEEASDDEEKSSQRSGSSSEELEVVSWTESFDPEVGGVVIAGSIGNKGSSIAMQVVVTVSLQDENGELIARVQGDLVQPSVPPNRNVSFRAAFQGVTDFAEVSFDIASRQLRLIPATPGGQA